MALDPENVDDQDITIADKTSACLDTQVIGIDGDSVEKIMKISEGRICEGECGESFFL